MAATPNFKTSTSAALKQVVAKSNGAATAAIAPLRQQSIRPSAPWAMGCLRMRHWPTWPSTRLQYPAGVPVRKQGSSFDKASRGNNGMTWRQNRRPPGWKRGVSRAVSFACGERS